MTGQTDKEEVHDRLEHQLIIKQPELLVNVTTLCVNDESRCTVDDYNKSLRQKL